MTKFDINISTLRKDYSGQGSKILAEPVNNIIAIESVLDEASRLVNGPRKEDYKHPRDDYDCTAKMWNAMIQKKYGVKVPLTADFCCLMMAAMKISREVGKHKRDNLVDTAGYILCSSMCLEEE